MTGTKTMAIGIGVAVLGWLLFVGLRSRHSGEDSARDPALYAEDYLGRLANQELLIRYVERHIEYLMARDHMVTWFERSKDGDARLPEPIATALSNAKEERDTLCGTLGKEATASGLDPFLVLVKSELRAKRIHRCRTSEGNTARDEGDGG